MICIPFTFDHHLRFEWRFPGTGRATGTNKTATVVIVVPLSKVVRQSCNLSVNMPLTLTCKLKFTAIICAKMNWQNTEKLANLLSPFHIRIIKSFQLQREHCPRPRALPLDPRWGLRHTTNPVAYRLALPRSPCALHPANGAPPAVATWRPLRAKSCHHVA